MNKLWRIKPNFFKDEEIFETEATLSLTGYLRIGCIGLLMLADDQGHFRWEPNILKIDILPFDKVNFENVLNGLMSCKIIGKYLFCDKEYGYFLDWEQYPHNHKELNIPNPPSKKHGKANSHTHHLAKKPIIFRQPTVNQVIPINKHKSINVIDFPIASKKAAHTTEKICLNYESIHRHCRLNQKCSLFSICKIFECWKRQMVYPQAKLHERHIESINRALNMGFNATELCHAIYGYKCAPFHKGYSQQHQYDNGLNIVFGNSKKIEYFIDYFRNSSDSNQPNLANNTILKSWLSMKYDRDEVDLNEND